MISRWLYTAMLILLLPLEVGRLYWRGRREPGYRQQIAERFGRYRQPPLAQSIWIHAVSVGEVRACAPLVQRCRRFFPHCAILLTCMTPTGRRTAIELFGDDVTLVYLPYDTTFFMSRLIARFNPCVALIMETEIWPNMIAACQQRNVPCLLVNARLSEKSRRGYTRHGFVRRVIAHAMQSLTAVGAQSDADAERLRDIGAMAPVVTGNMKFDFAPDPARVARGLRWREGVAPDRAVVVMTSTREGEEPLLLAAWRHRVGRSHAPLLVIVPRHPQRFDSVADLIETADYRLARRSEFSGGPEATPDFNAVDVWLGDSMGELASYYAMCDVAIIGGSFLPLGGQNLIEAAAAGKPSIMGPSTFNFAEAAQLAKEAGAMLSSDNTDEAIAHAMALVHDPERRAAISAAAIEFARSHAGATEKTLALFSQYAAVNKTTLATSA